MKDKDKNAYVEQIDTAIEGCINGDLKLFRDRWTEFIDFFVGGFYKNRKEDGSVTNFIEQAVTVFEALLCPSLPFPEIKSDRPGGIAIGTNLGLATHKVATQCKLLEQLRLCLVDSFFMCGVMKVGICLKDYVDEMEVGQPFVERISFDTYFCDTTAKNRRDMQFEGNDYWVSKSWAEAVWGGEFDCRKSWVDAEPNAHNVSHDESVQSYEDRVFLRDVFLLQEKKFITYEVSTKRLLVENEWTAPFSPYEVLGFRSVPDSVIPLSLVATIFGLNEKFNKLFDKCYVQGRHQKNVTWFGAGDKNAADAFKKATDLGAVFGSGSTQPKTVGTGGVQQPTLMFALQLYKFLNEGVGNLSLLGGTSAQAETVGQERILNNNANVRINTLTKKMNEFISNVYRKLSYYVWDDPFEEHKLYKKIEGTNLTVDTVWNFDSAVGDYEDWDFDINVVVEPDDSNQGKLQRMLGVMNQIIAPYMNFILQSGGSFDGKSFVEMISRWSHLPELNDVITFGGQQLSPEVAMQANMGGPKGEYVHKYQGGHGESGNEPNMEDMVNMMNSSSGGES